MRLLRGLLFLAGFVAAGPEVLAGQGMLTVREREPNGDTLAIGKNGIVDINSTLLIVVDRDSMRRVASTRVTPAAALSDLLSRLEGLVRIRDKALATIGPALVAWNASVKDKAAQKELHNGLDAALKAALQIIQAAPRGSRLRDRLNDSLRVSLNDPSGGPAELYRMVFDVAAAEAEALRIERDSLLKAAGVFIQVGGWSITAKGSRPLHFPGFDENPDLEAFDVERFGIGAIALTEEQKQELKQAGEVARKFNEGGVAAGLPDLSSGIRSAVGEAIRPLLDQSSACAERIGPRVEALLGLPRAIADTVRKQVQEALRPVEGLRATVIALKEKYQSGTATPDQSLAEFLVATNDDLAGLYRRVEAAQVGLLMLERSLAALPGAAGGELASRVNGVRASARECSAALLPALVSARGSAEAILNNLLGVRQINGSILAFTESVLRLDLDRIPDAIEFRLRYAGRRQAGDRILVRMLLGAADDPSPAREEYELTMFRIQKHMETIVGLIFADPLGSSALKSRFQAGPSYSLLLKGGSRKSVIANRLFLFGVGLNVAALDFDHDDTPELGAGVVISMLGDYLQGGIGLNVPRSRGYWFFGLRLPLPTFTLPGTSGIDTGD